MQLPYILPLFLGMTFDARTLKPGVDIFEAKYVDDPVEIEFGDYTSVYKVATTNSEVQAALDVDGDVALKIKSGLVDIKGKGSYIKNEDSSENFVDIVITSRYTSVVKAFKQGAKPIDDWEFKFPMQSLGTHFVKEVHYGAELYASAKFVILKSNETNDIKAEITGSLNTEGNTTKLFEANGTLDLLKKKLSGKVNVEISYYANVPLKSIPATLKGLEDLIDSFAEQYANTAKGKGAPMAIALEPLSALTEEASMKEQFRFEKDESLKAALSDFAIMFDELRQTRVDLHAWVKALPYDISATLRSEIAKLYHGIMETLDEFLKVLWHLDATKTPEQLNKAFDKYHNDGSMRFNRYRDQLSDLKQEYDSTNVLKEVSGATYIRYGNDKCPDEDSSSITQGFVFSSAEYGIGGSAKYDCADNSVDFLEEVHEEFGVKSHLAMIRYPEFIARHTPFMGKEAKKVSGKGIPCTRCHNPYLATVTMFPGKEQCPITWNLLYKGFLVSARADLGLSTEYICLDEEPSTPKHVVANQFPNYESVAFTTVDSHGSLSSAIFDKGPLRCVVCSINRNLKLFFKGE